MLNETRDYRDYQKRKLSGSSRWARHQRWRRTASPGALIHSALSSVAANEWDEVFIQAVNTSASAVKLTVEWGGTEQPGRSHRGHDTS